jgi:hypothetical protein
MSRPGEAGLAVCLNWNEPMLGRDVKAGHCSWASHGEATY